MRSFLFLTLLLVALGAAPAAAGVREFVATCAADGADLTRLPERLAAAGWVEGSPERGPQGPALAQDAERRRLWSLPGWDGGSGDAYVGLSPPSPGRPVEVCWHVSRPGESGAGALAALKRRFPPVGPVERGTAFFHGGLERWPARVAGGVVVFQVEWPMAGDPRQGFAMLALARVVGQVQ